MQVVKVSTKKRSEYGKPCVRFAEQGAEVILSVENGNDENYEPKQFFLSTGVQLHCQYSEHEVNTERCETESKGMIHLEGGWPKDVSIDDLDQLKRHRKKVEKDENFLACLFKLSKRVEECAKQHIAIDIYETDIKDASSIPQSPSTDTKLSTYCVINDPECLKRSISALSWNPGDPNRIAIGISSFNKQKSSGASLEENTEPRIYTYDCDKPQKPVMALNCESNVSCLAFNPKDSTQLLVGCQSGTVMLFDTRKGNSIGSFLGHKSAVQSVVWLQTKSGAEFLTGGQDGTVKWWDSRKVGEEPMEVLEVNHKSGDLSAQNAGGEFNHALGVTVTEFDSTMPTKLLIGTEVGLIFQANRKGKTPAEKLGPALQAFEGHVVTCVRNPTFPKFFLTSSHSTMNIWCDDVKESPVLNLRQSSSAIGDACWSLTRPTVLFIANKDGSVEVFDIAQSLEEPLERINVCKQPIVSIRMNHTGKRLAISNSTGKLFMVDIPESLHMLKKNEKALASSFFEREMRKEKLVESSKKEVNLRIKSAKKDPPAEVSFSTEIGAEYAAEFDEEEQAKASLPQIEEEIFTIFDQKANSASE